MPSLSEGRRVASGTTRSQNSWVVLSCLLHTCAHARGQNDYKYVFTSVSSVWCLFCFLPLYWCYINVWETFCWNGAFIRIKCYYYYIISYRYFELHYYNNTLSVTKAHLKLQFVFKNHLWDPPRGCGGQGSGQRDHWRGHGGVGTWVCLQGNVFKSCHAGHTIHLTLQWPCFNWIKALFKLTRFFAFLFLCILSHVNRQQYFKASKQH